jgi:hypothetical protein
MKNKFNFLNPDPIPVEVDSGDPIPTDPIHPIE